LKLNVQIQFLGCITLTSSVPQPHGATVQSSAGDISTIVKVLVFWGFFFGSTEVCTQGLKLAKQAL
jgi:hypothetical protein